MDYGELHKALYPSVDVINVQTGNKQAVIGINQPDLILGGRPTVLFKDGSWLVLEVFLENYELAKQPTIEPDAEKSAG